MKGANRKQTEYARGIRTGKSAQKERVWIEMRRGCRFHTPLKVTFQRSNERGMMRVAT